MGVVFLIVVILILAGFIYFNSTFPKVGPAANLTVKATPERIERGKYLANHVTVCMDCHSSRDWTRFSGPLIHGTEGKGGENFGKELGLPGTLYTKNITPYNLGSWSDGELFRVITSGVTKDGRVLFPIMNYPGFSQMGEEDIYSIIAYIRTLKPIENKVPDSKLDFPMNFIVKTLPQPYSSKKVPDRSDKVAYGKYLVTIAGCADCHTQSVKGEPVQGMHLAGGTVIKLPFGILRSANITPDKETGIGSWTKEDFIKRFKAYDNDTVFAKVNRNEFNTIMPWQFFAGMTEEDLGSIYEYLRSLKPVRNIVNRFTPPETVEAEK